jgi:hypothetical protein
MVEAAARDSRHVPTEQLMPPVPTARALMFAGIAALLGAAAWGLVSFYGNLEIGWLAWGIGAFVGFAAVKGGGHGTLVAFSASVLALLSIGTGKHLAFGMAVDQGVQLALEQHLTPAAHAKRVQDAADWVALGEQPTREQIRDYADGHGFDPTGPEGVADDEVALLRRFAADKPSLEQWRDQLREHAVASISFVDHLKEDFHPADILFVLLGIASAFGLVSNYTTSLQVAARESERKRRKAEAAAAPPPSAE